jgi:hypothetical protein
MQGQARSQLESFKDYDDFEEPVAMRHIDADRIDDDLSPTLADIADETGAVSSGVSDGLDPVSLQPAAIDLNLFTDKDARKIAEKEQKRLMKVYQQAVKYRESAIKDRKKLAEKREKKVRQDREKKLKAGEAKRLKEEREGEKRKASLIQPTSPGEPALISLAQPKQDSEP